MITLVNSDIKIQSCLRLRNEAVTLAPSDQLPKKDASEMILKPDPVEGQITVSVDDERRWSLLVPETISCRELALPECHVIPPNWSETATGRLVTQSFEEARVRYECSIDIIDDGTLELMLTVHNDRDEPMTDTEADFCCACAYCVWNTPADDVDRSWINPPFHGPRKEKNTDWADRSLIATRDGMVAVAEINKHFPVPSNRVVPGKNIADFPFIMCQSEDRTEIFGIGWDRASRLFCAMCSCIHAVAWLGTIPADESCTRRGRFYYAKTDPYQLLARFQRDFDL